MSEAAAKAFEKFQADVGNDEGTGEWFQVTQDQIDQFADVTYDHQFIHVDPVAAASTPFGGTIAHGLLTLALLPYFMHQLYLVDGITMAINYGLNKVRFISPVPVGAKVRARGVVGEVTAVGGGVQAIMTTTIEIDGADKPAAVIESIIRYVA